MRVLMTLLMFHFNYSTPKGGKAKIELYTGINSFLMSLISITLILKCVNVNRKGIMLLHF